MDRLHLIPQWFFGLNIFFQILFFLFTTAIALYAYRIYKISNQEQSKIFALAFGLLSIANISIVILNGVFLSLIGGNLMALDFFDILELKAFLALIYMGTLIMGFVTLFFATLKSWSIKSYLAILVLSAIAICLSMTKSLTVYLISSLFLLLITYNYFCQYKLNKNKNTLFVALGMLSLLLCSIIMGFVGDHMMAQGYVLAVLLEIVGYAFIITSLARIIKNGKKTK